MGGGGGGDPGAEARQQEADRQARIKAATAEINRIFNNEVKTQGTRYKSGGSGLFNREPSYMTESEYTTKKKAYDDAIARNAAMQSNRNNSPFLFGDSNDGGQSAPYGYVTVRGIGRDNTSRRPKTVEEFTAEQLGFSPDKWKAEAYDVWTQGDPANSRDALYAEQKNAVYDLNKREVDRQAGDAERLNRFGLARTGLLGGSVNVDSVADLNRRTNEGLMRAGGIADQASADLKTADERTRSNLISLAQSGIDSGTAAQQALKGLEVNTANAASARAGSTVGGLFDDMSQAYLFNQQNQGRQAAQQYGSQWFGVSNPRTGDSGSVTR